MPKARPQQQFLITAELLHERIRSGIPLAYPPLERGGWDLKLNLEITQDESSLLAIKDCEHIILVLGSGLGTPCRYNFASRL